MIHNLSNFNSFPTPSLLLILFDLLVEFLKQLHHQLLMLFLVLLDFLDLLLHLVDRVFRVLTY